MTWENVRDRLHRRWHGNMSTRKPRTTKPRKPYKPRAPKMPTIKTDPDCLPCPFCGWKEIRLAWIDNEFCFGECEGCWTMGPTAKCEDEAREKWNERHVTT